MDVHAPKTVKLAHLADIHIQDRRRDEYSAVFTALYASLQEEQPDIIVVAGDVFDSKTKASAVNFSDVADFLKALTAIAPTVMIAGNHDTNCGTPGALDLLTPVLRDHKHLQQPRLIYWRNSGVYVAHGIVWAVIAPDAGSKPQLSEIEATVAAHRLESAPRICLFHEEVNGALFSNGIAMQDFRIVSRDFDPFDAVLGGHIHLRQMITPRAAYCGSLIQQNIGETHIGHGYLVWKLSLSQGAGPYRTQIPQVRGVDIPNTRGGYLRVEMANGKDITSTPLPAKPQYWEVVHDGRTPLDVVEAATAKLTAIYGFGPRNVYAKIGPDQTGDGPKIAAADILRAQEASRSLSEHETIIREILGEAHPELAEVLQMHREKYAHTSYAQQRRARFRLLRLEFDNLYCYGPGNVVDFTKLERGLSGIIAPNFAGKSSFIEALLFALYDIHPRAPTKGDMVRTGATSYRTVLEFELDGKRGRLEKTVRGRTGKHALQVKLFYDNEELTQGTGPDTLKEAKKLLGDPQHVLESAIMLQGSDNQGVVAATPDGRKKIFAEVLALGGFAEIEKGTTKEFTAANAFVKAYSNQFAGQTAEELDEEVMKIEGDADDIKIDLNQTAAQLCALNNERGEWLAQQQSVASDLRDCRTRLSLLPEAAAQTPLNPEQIAKKLANSLSRLQLKMEDEVRKELVEWDQWAVSADENPVSDTPAYSEVIHAVQIAMDAQKDQKQFTQATHKDLDQIKTELAVLNDRVARLETDQKSAEDAAKKLLLSSTEELELLDLEQAELPDPQIAQNFRDEIARTTQLMQEQTKTELAVLEDRIARLTSDQEVAECKAEKLLLPTGEELEFSDLEQSGLPSLQAAQTAYTQALEHATKARLAVESQPTETMKQLQRRKDDANFKERQGVENYQEVEKSQKLLDQLRLCHATILGAKPILARLQLDPGCAGCKQTAHLLSTEGARDIFDEIAVLEDLIREGELARATKAVQEQKNAENVLETKGRTLNNVKRLGILRIKHGRFVEAKTIAKELDSKCSAEKITHVFRKPGSGGFSQDISCVADHLGGIHFSPECFT